MFHCPGCHTSVTIRWANLGASPPPCRECNLPLVLSVACVNRGVLPTLERGKGSTYCGARR